ncbi:MAG: YqaE/Pmp3 family membrane protein [Chloroflexota bacterium]
MTPWRVLLCIFLPPLAVLDKGCGLTLLVGVLWLLGGVPGIVAAFAINLMDPQPQPVKRSGEPRFVQIPVQYDSEFDAESVKPKRKGAYVRLADGAIAEVIEDDGAMPDVRKLKDD